MSSHRSEPDDSTSVHVLRDLALVADGQRGALIGPDGDVVWMCAPRWHDAAVLSQLIGGGGSYSVTPEGRYTWGGSYEDGTLIWRSRWAIGSSIVECAAALALPADPHRVVLLQRIRGIRGPASLRVTVDIRGRFGSHTMQQIECLADGTWTARTGDLRVRWTGGQGAQLDPEGRLVMTLPVAAGDTHDLVLEVSDRPLPAVPDSPLLWESTRRSWQNAVPRLEQSAAPRDARLAAAVLSGLSSPGGGMVAAATLGLPERADEQRNYDYRFAWIRDQCYAGMAAAAAGLDDLVDGSVRFVSERLLDAGSELKPAYLIDGQSVPAERTLSVPGYPGGSAVAGNWVNQQFQLDAFGEVLRLLSAAARLDRLGAEGWQAARLALQSIATRWDERDAGIWELSPAWWTHSRLAAVAGLRQAAMVLPDGGERADASALADRILAKTAQTCLHRDGYWQRSPQDTGVDAALVWPAVCGALPTDDPRTTETLRQVMGTLTDDEYAYRYRIDGRPLGSAEGAFLLCGFMVSMALAQQGDDVGAARWFERNRSACGSPGLFTEEYDVAERQLRGNIPQAFVHAALLHASV